LGESVEESLRAGREHPMPNRSLANDAEADVSCETSPGRGGRLGLRRGRAGARASGTHLVRHAGTVPAALRREESLRLMCRRAGLLASTGMPDQARQGWGRTASRCRHSRRMYAVFFNPAALLPATRDA